MGKVLPCIGPNEEAFIASQKVFFVATAPLDGQHHVSLSPKCNGCIVLAPYEVAYADLSGSGAETAAHVLQNGRMTLMFCNLEQGPPKILRLFGQAEVVMANDVPKYIREKLPVEIVENIGFRAVYKLNVTRVSTSCGYSMPVMEFVKYRKTLDEFSEKLGARGIFEAHTRYNSFSIDGLPSLALLRKDAPKNVVPVEEEGFVRGEVVEHGGDTAKPKSCKLKSPTNARKFDRVALNLLIFAAGLTAGILVANRTAMK